MRIGIDGRCLEEGKISGVGEYASELLGYLFENDCVNQYVIFTNSFRERPNQKYLSYFLKFPNVEIKKFRFPNKFLNFSFWYFNAPKINSLTGKIDVFFAPNINFISLKSDIPLVITFHDLSFEKYPGFFSKKTFLWHYGFVNPRKLARKAAKIIAVSDSTKNDLENIYGIKKEKIATIHHGVSREYRVLDRNNAKLFEIQKKYRLPYKFILFLGSVEPRKNASSLVKSFESLRERNPEFSKYKLVIVGQLNSSSKKVLDEISKSKYEKDIIFTDYVDRDDKVFLYNLAELFVYPSFFEGFGLPVIEAMASGTPVITSDKTSLPEISGEAALLVDPHRPDEIRRAMELVLGNKKVYEKFRERGIEQAKKYSWKKCAKETALIIQNTKIGN